MQRAAGGRKVWTLGGLLALSALAVGWLSMQPGVQLPPAFEGEARSPQRTGAVPTPALLEGDLPRRSAIPPAPPPPSPEVVRAAHAKLNAAHEQTKKRILQRRGEEAEIGELLSRLAALTEPLLEAKWEAGDYEVIDKGHPRKLDRDDRGRLVPFSLRWVDGETQQVVLTQAECPEAFELLSLVDERKRERNARRLRLGQLRQRSSTGVARDSGAPFR